MSLEISSSKGSSLSTILKPKFVEYIKKTGKKPNVIIMSSDYKYTSIFQDSIEKLFRKGYKIVFSYEIPKKSIFVAYIPNLILKDEIEEKLPF